MAHPCIYCGSECYCSGDIDDVIVSKTPKGCEGCGCEEFAEDQGWNDDDYEYDDDEDSFQPCCDCDLPDSCADYGCAQKQGLKRVQGDWDCHDDLT